MNEKNDEHYTQLADIANNAYAFDALSRPTARTTGTTGISPVDSTFAYNNRSEVVSAAIGTNLFTHAYDDIGNHLLFGDNATTNTYTHNNLNQITSLLRASQPLAAPSGFASLRQPDRYRDGCISPPRELTHSLDGGLASDGTWSYAYDAEDQLLSVTSSSLTNGAIRVLNTYDYRHRRTSKTVQRLYSTIPPPPAPPIGVEEWQTLETRTFVYDDWNLIHETIYAIEGSITNITEIQYFWGLDLSGTIQGAGGVGGLLAVSRNGQLYFPTFDNNGNITKYIDEFGNLVATYEYDDFGRTISQSGTLADFFRHRFSTKYYDPETGLCYYLNRFYSSEWHIWLNRDPIGGLGGKNIYMAFNNTPLTHFDPLGFKAYVVWHLPGDDLLYEWSARDTTAETHFRSSAHSVMPISCGAGKTTYKVTLTPPMSLIDVYFRRSLTMMQYMLAKRYEEEHVALYVAYDKCIEEFKQRVENICACRKEAEKQKKDAEDWLGRKARYCKARNEFLDRKGGPHGH